jgi:hypothetical protein
LEGQQGDNKQQNGLEDTDGVAMIFHCNHRTRAANGNHTCSQDVMPAKAMKLSADDVKAQEEIIVLGPEERLQRHGAT